MSTAERFIPTYTVGDYLQWQGDWELIDGVAIAMTPSPIGRHERIVSKLVHHFLSSIEQQQCDCHVYAGLDWIVHEHTVVRPDVMIVCGRQPERHLEWPPDLVVEVLSPATAVKDRTTKRVLYESAGVAIYLMVDPDTDSVECYERSGQQYQLRSPHDAQLVRLPSGCELKLPQSEWIATL